MCGTPTGNARLIQGYDVWRDRLLVLKDAYDQATPAHLDQWWLDRRDGVTLRDGSYVKIPWSQSHEIIQSAKFWELQSLRPSYLKNPHAKLLGGVIH